mgnify:CR=1 FL=1
MTYRSTLTALVLALGVFGLAGCATIENGRRQRVEVHSQPSGASVTIDGVRLGKTPLAVSLPRKSAYQISFEKEGFNPGRALLLPSSNSYDQRFLRWGVDYLTGASNELSPTDVSVQLRPSVLPVQRPTDPYAEMVYNVLQADALLETGMVNRRDHSYMVAKIVEFYAQ